jgi:two-component system chemotaxis response regulator CheB
MHLPCRAPLRVFIADDSAVMRECLRRMVESEASLEVCGTAHNGLDALEQIRRLQPDVVTLDIEMPLLNGIEVLKQIMNECPRPVIMVSSHTQHGAELTLQALALGAFDYLPKSHNGNPTEPRKLQQELLAKIEAAAHSPLGPLHQRASSVLLPAPLEKFQSVAEVVAIGTSTGGPRALQEIFSQLPPGLPAPVIVVQHMPVGFTRPLADRLNVISPLRVREAEHGDSVRPGVVYVAPAGCQLALQRGHDLNITISLSDDFTDELHKPSVDFMMLSVAEIFGRHALGIILTGMGSDGVLGMTAISKVGGITIGQDAATSTVYGMPRACAEKGVLHRIVPLEEIPQHILEAVGYRSPDYRSQLSLTVAPDLHGSWPQ